MSFGRRSSPPRAQGDAESGNLDAPDGEDPASVARRAYATAIKLLGARDHSSAELARKLGDRDVAPELIDSTLQELREANYVNDERYALTYVEQRMARGYGPRAIESKLHERGIESALVRHAFEQVSPDWSALAHEALLRKFRSDQITDTDQKVKAKLARFLQQRGFGTRDAIRAIERARETV